jgi:hypothetical protein
MPFGLQKFFQHFDSAGIFGVEFATGFECPPVRGHPLLAGCGGFIRGMGGDPGEDAGGDRTAGSGFVFLGNSARISLIVISFPRGTLRITSSTSRGAGITIVPAPHLALALPVSRKTLGRSLSSANFSCHDLRGLLIIAISSSVLPGESPKSRLPRPGFAACFRELGQITRVRLLAGTARRDGR